MNKIFLKVISRRASYKIDITCIYINVGLVSSHISFHMIIIFFKSNPSKKLDG
jgi:hypothetical protein